MGCGCSKPMPNKFRQAGNAAMAAGRVVKAVLKDEPIRVSDEVYAARLAVCHACPERVEHRRGNESFSRCAKCGCWLSAFFSKARLATETCPLNKWEAA